MALTGARTIPRTRQMVRDALQFVPTGIEQAAIIDTDGLYIILSGGEQGGKSFDAAEFYTERSFEIDTGANGGPPIIWLVGRRYADTEKEYEYGEKNYRTLGVLDYTSGTQIDKHRRMVLTDGTVIKTLSVAETMNIGREAPDIIVACEASQISYEGYMKLRLRAGASGGHLFMSGTLEAAQPWFRQLWHQWRAGTHGHRSYNLPSWSNPHMYPGGRNDPKIISLMMDLTPEMIAERMEGIPRKPAGLVFGKDFDESLHIRDIDYIPGLPVHIAVDPGYNQSVHALYYIQEPPEGPIHVFDEIYTTEYTTEDMADEVQVSRYWIDLAESNRSVIDIQATRNQQSLNNLPVDVWQQRTGLSLRSQYVKIEDGIDRFKTFLRVNPVTNEPRIVFAPRCHGILSELGVENSPITDRLETYRWDLDKNGDLKTKTPRDRHNHGIKAVTYWEMVNYGPAMAHDNIIPVTSWARRRR